jgi:hypothetical protein
MQTIFVTESIDYELVAESIPDEELARIRELEESPSIRAEDLALYVATLATEHANANKRQYTREWQSKYAEQFTGLPVTVGHTPQRVGGVLRSWSEEGRTRGKLYVLRTTPGAPEAIKTLESGGLSLEGYVRGQRADGVLRIVPGPYTRVQAVSIVPNPADSACVAAREAAAPEAPQNSIPAPPASATDPMAIFAREALAELAAEAVRYAGLTLGTGARETYQKVAESLDPLALREWVATLKRAYADAHKPDLEHLKAVEATAQAELAQRKAADNAPDLGRATEIARQIGRYK